MWTAGCSRPADIRAVHETYEEKEKTSESRLASMKFILSTHADPSLPGSLLPTMLPESFHLSEVPGFSFHHATPACHK